MGFVVRNIFASIVFLNNLTLSLFSLADNKLEP